MKGVVVFCITLLWYTGVVSVAESAEMGLAGAWLFDETSGNTVKDLVGGNDGEIQGSVEREATGKFGRALKFPGKGDSYVSIPHADVFDSDPYTFVAWVKLEAASWQYIAWMDGEVWDQRHNKRRIDIWIHQDDYAVIMWNIEGGGVEGEGRADGQAIVADGNWHHVAKVSDKTSMKLYIDGKLDVEEPMGGKLVINGVDPLWIGARPGDVAATGLFDEIGFFTEALSEAELTKVKNGGLADVAAVSSSGKLAITWGKVKGNSLSL